MLRKDAFLSLYFLGIYTALSRLVDGTLIKWIFFKKLLTMTPLKFILLHKCAECTRENQLKTRNFKPVCGEE